jgi:hypothetical protein
MVQAMAREVFYGFIDQAREDTSPRGESADADLLQEALTDLTDEQVLSFALRYEQEIESLNRWDIWAVGYIAEGGMSDDGFDYFRPWLVGKGAATVDAVLADPDNLADFLPEDAEYFENEELMSVVPELLEERGLEDPRLWSGAEPRGEQFDEESDLLYQTYPKTTAAAVALGSLELED